MLLAVCLPVYTLSEFLKPRHEVLNLREFLKPVREVEHPFPSTLALVDGDRGFPYLHDPDLVDPRAGDILQLGDDGGEFGPFIDLLDEPIGIVKGMDGAA